MLSEKIFQYINSFFGIIINNRDLEFVRKRMLPTINLDNTNEIIEVLLKKLREEYDCLCELDTLDPEDISYKKYIEDVTTLFKSIKTKDDVPDYSDGVSCKKNILLFSQIFVEQLLKIDDLEYISIIKHCIELLECKEITTENYSNFTGCYKRLHGEASGLSEVKGKGIRLLHMPIDKNLWVVLAVVKKKATSDKIYNQNLVNYKKYGTDLIEGIRRKCSLNGKLNYSSIVEIFKSNNNIVHDFLENMEEKKSGKRL